MANIENQDPSGEVKSGTTLKVTGAESENDVTLAVENYLRQNQVQSFEIALSKDSGSSDYIVKLS